MLILHNEDTFRSNRQVFTELLVAGLPRLINLEMRSQIADLDHTKVVLLYNAAVRGRPLLQEKDGEAQIQANASDTVHNHVSILPALAVTPKE